MSLLPECTICKRRGDMNTHQCNWAVLEGACEHPRKWNMGKATLSQSQKEYLNDGWEPFAVVYDPEDAGPRTAVYFRRIEPCEECKKV